MRNAPNPWVGKNYIPDNPRMEIPPAYFLSRLWDQDAMLVMMPSRYKPFAYVLARRKQWAPGITEKAIDAVYTQPDTKMCIMHGCVPVCMVFKVGSSWNPDPLIRSLQARDMWAHGGPEKVAKMLEEQEEAEKAKTLAGIRQEMWDRSGEAWRSYQSRTGQTTNSPYGQTRAAKPQPGRRNVNSPSTSGRTSVSSFVRDRE